MGRLDPRIIVDDEDRKLLVKYTWSIHPKLGYPMAYIGGGRKNCTVVTMHKFLMGDPPAGHSWDHKNGNKLDNRRCNLRPATPSQQGMNKKVQRNKIHSQYVGVTWFRRDSKWKAQIMLHGKNYHLGYFHDEYEAHLAYIKKRDEFFGEFARKEV
jgi:hypothetical protein